MTRPPLGYLVGSHVAYQHVALPRLLDSMFACGIPAERIVIAVNGSARPHVSSHHGAPMQFVTGQHECPMRVLVDRYNWAGKTGINHWLSLNTTSVCGPDFFRLTQDGFDPDVDSTLAGAALSLGQTGGKWGRAINDLATYSAEYLRTITGEVWDLWDTASIEFRITDLEGYLFAHAPKQAAYPRTGYELDRGKVQDVYGTGVMRATEYYYGIDWYRYKRNFGQLGGEYNLAEM